MKRRLNKTSSRVEPQQAVFPLMFLALFLIKVHNTIDFLVFMSIGSSSKGFEKSDHIRGQ